MILCKPLGLYPIIKFTQNFFTVSMSNYVWKIFYFYLYFELFVF